MDLGRSMNQKEVDVNLTYTEITEFTAMLARYEILRSHNLDREEVRKVIAKMILTAVGKRGLNPRDFGVNIAAGKILKLVPWMWVTPMPECYD